MRRDNRRREEISTKTLLKIWVSILIVAIIFLIIGIKAFNEKINSNIEEGKSSIAKITDIVPNETVVESNWDTSEASSSIGKTVAEVLANDNTHTLEAIVENESITEVVDKQEKTTEMQQTEKVNDSQESKEKKEISFEKPVAGEVIREFAVDKLVYSQTLQEWVVHNGIDIKANKTSVVKASADGEVIAIKNDPRYGLTIVIEHDEEYKTVYSNLLTAEFVVEGEKVTSGQTIGTVGNSAVFESCDEPHLHFEIIKNGEYVDPEIYL